MRNSLVSLSLFCRWAWASVCRSFHSRDAYTYLPTWDIRYGWELLRRPRHVLGAAYRVGA